MALFIAIFGPFWLILGRVANYNVYSMKNRFFRAFLAVVIVAAVVALFAVVIRFFGFVGFLVAGALLACGLVPDCQNCQE